MIDLEGKGGKEAGLGKEFKSNMETLEKIIGEGKWWRILSASSQCIV
jgi:hypothetical protein